MMTNTTGTTPGTTTTTGTSTSSTTSTVSTNAISTNTSTVISIDDQIKSLREQINILKIQKESYELEGNVIIQELTTSPSLITNSNDGIDDDTIEDDDNKDNDYTDYSNSSNNNNNNNRHVNHNNNTKKTKSIILIPPPGIDTPLIDTDGYPRADIDIYRVRTIRGRLQVLRTDHKVINLQIEQLLYTLSSLVKQKNQKTQSLDNNGDNKKSDSLVSESDFVIINKVGNDVIILDDEAHNTQVKQNVVENDNDNNSNEQVEIEHQARLAYKPKPRYDPIRQQWILSNWDGTDLIINSTVGTSTSSSTSITTPATTTAIPATTVSDIISSTITETTTKTTTILTQQNTKQLKPFAIVNSIDINSPAYNDGLMKDDKIILFDTITIKEAQTNFNIISNIVLTAASTNSSITIIVLRKQQQEEDEQEYTILLRPRTWNGRGVVGCHILPFH